MRYDNGNLAVVSDLGELELYVEQNSSRRIQRKREIRMALRALEGQTVRWPYKHIIVSALDFRENILLNHMLLACRGTTFLLLF